ncbi:MAG: hypothetical protein J0G96_08370 [Flavobacteriia bacterium]|nr:hypothetical protein [Flavobacteriia bacterium]OJX34925.1 MAG: hypothetical protein BGO87_09295 [Flavobacteriia bacterium 40-80]
MKEYFSTYSKEQVFILDEDGDNYSSFDKAIEFINENTLESERSIKHDFIDGGSGFFIKDGITIKISCSNWDGTELRVDTELLTEADLQKIRQWAKEIYDYIHDTKKSL